MNSSSLRAVVIGGGPAGLMAAEVLSAGGAKVSLFDAMPSVGRKFLLAGKGGLNLTHSEPMPDFLGRFGAARGTLEPSLSAFGPAALRAWAEGLGVATFVGSSGRVFPTDMKAAPLLRAWLHRLRTRGVNLHMRHRWTGWQDGQLRFATPQGTVLAEADAVLLALGGASWPRLGSDAAWVPMLAERGVDLTPLAPSNCGFDVARPGTAEPSGWSTFFRSRFAGHPVKNVAMSVDEGAGQAGEFLVTEGGVEGSLVYALSGQARDAIAAGAGAWAYIDLLPNRSPDFVRDEVMRPRGSRSLSTHLKSRLGIEGVKAALLHELLPRELIADPMRLAVAIKRLPLGLSAPRPITEAISSAGGVRFDALDETLMLRAVPGTWCAGEMLDWEAPTGGYLLTACFATGAAAARGMLRRTKG